MVLQEASESKNNNNNCLEIVGARPRVEEKDEAPKAHVAVAGNKRSLEKDAHADENEQVATN